MEIHGLSMLNCLITIGDEDPNDTLHILNKITVNEVVNLQIKDSYPDPYQYSHGGVHETDHDQILFERRVRNQRGQTCG